MFSGQEKVQSCVINSAGEPSPGGEASPSYFEDERGHATLSFSIARAGRFAPDAGSPASDIYFSVNFGLAQLSPNLNTVSDDSRPIVRHDGREIVFDSNRPGGFGGLDILTASRETTADDWSTPTNLGPLINSAATDARAMLSRDGLTMFSYEHQLQLPTTFPMFTAMLFSHLFIDVSARRPSGDAGILAAHRGA